MSLCGRCKFPSDRDEEECCSACAPCKRCGSVTAGRVAIRVPYEDECSIFIPITCECLKELRLSDRDRKIYFSAGLYTALILTSVLRSDFEDLMPYYVDWVNIDLITSTVEVKHFVPRGDEAEVERIRSVEEQKRMCSDIGEMMREYVAKKNKN